VILTTGTGREEVGYMDERVAAAVSHWAPRFTTNGITVSDFQTITAGLERWEDWCSAWSAAGEKHAALGHRAMEEGRNRSAGGHFAQAASYFHFGKFVFVDDLDQMRAAHQRAVECLDAALPNLDPPGRRVEVPFDGAVMVGILRLPRGDGPHPVVLMIPGLDSTKEEFRSTEALFLERGLATFAVDGPGQGEAEYDLPIRGDWEVPGRVLVDTLAELPEIDGERIGVWGVSLGGYYAPRVASGEPRVQACIALAGPWNFGECWDQLPTLTRNAFRVRSRSTDDATARERAHELSLEGRASAISCPLLVVAGRLDRLIPWQHAVKLAEQAGGETELLMLETGNHGCMNVAQEHRPYSADWMAARLDVKETP
jgi:dipeptidyl aminopeptidase/acylaminoacyl peptidase